MLLLLQLHLRPLPAPRAELHVFTLLPIFSRPKILPGLRTLLPMQPNRRSATVTLCTEAGKNGALSAGHSGERIEGSFVEGK